MHRILVIEDDSLQAAGLMRHMRNEGLHCEWAATFAEGVAQSHAMDFDCIILDLGMPDDDLLTEYDTAGRIEELRGHVVVYTGTQDARIFEVVRATGAAIAIKPGVEILVEKVWSQINHQRSDRASQLGQQRAQRRLAAPLEEGTMVSVSLGRLFAIIGTLIVGTGSITAVVLNKVGTVDHNVSAIRESITANTLATNQRLSAFEVELKAQGEATQVRIRDWTKWRWNVSRDLHQLGETTKTPISTPPE